jgi:hypothetical protein
MVAIRELFDRIWPRARGPLSTLGTLAVVLVIIVIGQLLPPMQALDAFLKDHKGLQDTLLVGTIAMTIVGTLTLALAQFLPEPRRPDAMSDKDIEAQSPPVEYRESRRMRRDRWSRENGRVFRGEASFSSAKEAWRLGSWRYDRNWRLLFVMALGALLLMLGLFGLFIVIAEPGVKFLMILVLVFALGRTAWGLARA